MLFKLKIIEGIKLITSKGVTKIFEDKETWVSLIDLCILLFLCVNFGWDRIEGGKELISTLKIDAVCES